MDERCPYCGRNLSRQVIIGFGGWHHGWGWGGHGWHRNDGE